MNKISIIATQIHPIATQINPLLIWQLFLEWRGAKDLEQNSVATNSKVKKKTTHVDEGPMT